MLNFLRKAECGISSTASEEIKDEMKNHGITFFSIPPIEEIYMELCKREEADIVEIKKLLKRVSNVDENRKVWQMDYYMDETLLHTAVSISRIDIVKEFILCGADVNIIFPRGNSALMLVNNDVEIARLLLFHGAGRTINVGNSAGFTALHIAAHYGNHDIVQLLLANGADKTIKNKLGEAPRC